MTQPPTPTTGKAPSATRTRALYVIIILLLTILVGMVVAWAQCVPGDLVCMTLD